jgi:hypothetical protein
MELPEVQLIELLAFRMYLVVCYRDGQPCTYELYDGASIANNKDHFSDGQDFNQKPLTFKFFLLPVMVR